MLKVYGHPLSTCTRKVLTVLEEKGQPAEFITIDLMKGEQKKPEYLAKQPFGVVPVLEDGDFRLFESRAIIRYLDGKFATPALQPAELKARSTMEQWMQVEQSYFTPGAMKIIMQNLFAPMGGGTPNEQIVEQGRLEVQRALDVMDKHLAGKEYFAGEQFSLADLGYMPYVEYLFAAKAGNLITSRANVSAWWSRVSHRPSWQKVVGKSKQG